MSKNGAKSAGTASLLGLAAQGKAQKAMINPAIKSAGTAKLGGLTGKPSGGTRPTTPAPTPAAPAPVAAPVTPFLTPSQQAAWNKYQSDYASQLTNFNNQLATAVTKHNNDVTVDTQKYAQGQDNTAQAMAARGMFESGIKTTAMADLDTAYQLQITNLNTALNATKLQVGGAMNNANTNYNYEQNMYEAILPAENAQAADNGLPAGGAAGTAPGTQPAQPTQPTTTGLNPNSGIASAGTANLGGLMRGNSGRVGKPKQPKINAPSGVVRNGGVMPTISPNGPLSAMHMAAPPA